MPGTYVRTPEIRAKQSASAQGRHTPHSEETKAKITAARRRRPTKIGMTIGGLHTQAARIWGRSNLCEACNQGPTDWANWDHSYNQPLVREEWAELCRACHKEHDFAAERENYAELAPS